MSDAAEDRPLPCPFCGCDRIHAFFGEEMMGEELMVRAECNYCEAKGPPFIAEWDMDKEEAKQAAIDFWNDRKLKEF